MRNIKVSEFIGKEFCISSDDAKKLFDYLKDAIDRSERLTVSFDGVLVIVSVFLNIAIGQLYGYFSEEEIKASIVVEGLEPDDVELLHRVEENAKEYYANAKNYDEAWRKEVYE